MVDLSTQTPSQGQQPENPVASSAGKPVVKTPPPVGINPIKPLAPVTPSTDGQTVPSVPPSKKSISLVFVLLGVLIVAVLAGGGYYLYSTNSLPFLSEPEPVPVLPSPSPIVFEKVSESAELSADDSEEMIEKELNETMVDDFSEDFEELKKETGEL